MPSNVVRGQALSAVARSIVVSPSHELDLGASGVNALPWGGVKDDLEVGLLALWQEGKEYPILFASFDALYVGRRMRRALVEASGLPEDRVVTFASHTHRAPMMDDSKQKLGKVDEDYLRGVEVRLRETVADLMVSQAELVTLYISRGKANHSVNRRKWKPFTLSIPPAFSRVVSAPNFRGSRDESVLTATLRKQSGEACAVIWNYACHPVAGPSGKVVSAHYPGVVRGHIRHEEKIPSIPVLFIQGFSGDTRPRASARANGLIRRVQRILTGPVFDRMTEADYLKWARGLADVVGGVRQRESIVESVPFESVRYPVDGAKFYRPAKRPVWFHRVSLGRLVILGVEAEVVSSYASRVRAMVGTETVMCGGCMDDPFGYLPVSEMLTEGGYEVDGFCPEFGLEALNNSVEEAAFEGFRRVLDETRPKVDASVS